MSYMQASRTLRDARFVAVVAHVNPDADAIGSACALSQGLRQLGVTTRMMIGQRYAIPDNLLSIPHADEVELADELGTPHDGDETSMPSTPDVVVTVDCGSLDRTGSLSAEIAAFDGPVINIDHHDTNPAFGSINVIDSTRESTTVVLYELFKTMGIVLNHDIAHALYAGLMTDTGSFRWGSPVMHTMAAQLMTFGLDTKKIAVDLIDSASVDDLRMMGEVFDTIRVETAGEVTMAILQVSHSIVNRHNQSAIEKLVDFVRALDGTNMGVVFKEKGPQYWNVSLRSRQIDCSQVAAQLGGGGHIPAAGYSTRGDGEAVIAELVNAVRSFS